MFSLTQLSMNLVGLILTTKRKPWAKTQSKKVKKGWLEFEGPSFPFISSSISTTLEMEWRGGRVSSVAAGGRGRRPSKEGEALS